MTDDFQVQEEGKPLTRQDVIRLLVEAGSSGLLDLSFKNLQGANLTGLELIYADFRNANLTDVNLAYGDLKQATLSFSNLKKSNLTCANLEGANLNGTNLKEANLFAANLISANLIGADLRGANLCDADLRGADLTGADLSEANLTGINLSEANLKNVVGIDKITAPNIYQYSFTLQINLKSLAAYDFANFITTVNELYIKIWLIAQNRIEDLDQVDFCNNYNEKPFVEEAGLLIGKLSHNSPAWIEFIPRAAAAAAMFASIPRLIHSIFMIPTNLDKSKKEAALDIESKQLDLAQKKLKLFKELKKEFSLDDTQVRKAQESILKTLSHCPFSTNEITVK